MIKSELSEEQSRSGTRRRRGANSLLQVSPIDGMAALCRSTASSTKTLAEREISSSFRFDPTSPDQNLSREGIYLIFGDVFSAGFDVVVIVVLLLLLWIRI